MKTKEMHTRKGTHYNPQNNNIHRATPPSLSLTYTYLKELIYSAKPEQTFYLIIQSRTFVLMSYCPSGIVLFFFFSNSRSMPFGRPFRTVNLQPCKVLGYLIAPGSFRMKVISFYLEVYYDWFYLWSLPDLFRKHRLRLWWFPGWYRGWFIIQ